MNTDKIYNIASVVFLFLGSLTFLITYVRASITKSDRDIDKNTIRSLKDNNAALVNERDTWKERALTAEGKNQVLQNTVTAAPEIAKLAAKTAEQHNESMSLQKTIIQELQSFITAVRGQKA